MSQMINLGKGLLRIDPKDPRRIQYSRNDGSTWSIRYWGSSSTGTFIDLTDNGKEILATTSTGVYYSKNNGSNWARRS